MFKTLSLTENVVFEFNGTVLKNALGFGDIDNDGFSEFIIGNSDGVLTIFRDSTALCSSFELGSISAIGVGDLLNINKNVLVVITLEGYVHVFDVQNSLQASLKEEKAIIFPFHTQRIPPNTKSLLLADFNFDGLIELAICLTDRVVRTYQWQKLNNLTQESGHLVGLNKWEFGTQIGSISKHKNSMLLSHPGGNIRRIKSKSSIKIENNVSTSTEPGVLSTSSTSTSTHRKRSISTNFIDLEFFSTLPQPQKNDGGKGKNSTLIDSLSLNHISLTNKAKAGVSCEVIGNITFPPLGQVGDSYALVTLDGTLVIARENEIQWSMELNNIVLNLNEINGNVVVTTWDGDTYLINGNIPTRFHFGESISTSTTGMYATDSEDNSETIKVNRPSVAYVAFNERVYIYSIEI